MKKELVIQDKIIWRGKLTGDLAATFYPSFYKDILKKEASFSTNFRPVFEDATLENLDDLFVPLYQSEIMSRPNFNLDRNGIIDSMRQRIEKNPAKYKFLFIFNNTGELLGATLFSIVDTKLQMAFRAYKRDVRIVGLKHKASLDYWGEKLIKEYAIKMGLTVFSHGRDSHPYVGKSRIGLALYKIKAGTRPMLPKLDDPEKPVETVEIDEPFLFSKNEPVIFFDSPDKDGFYQNCSFYYPSGSVHESFINEFGVVCEWAGLFFRSVAY